jgi:putative transposase
MPENIELIFIPPTTPEMNPMEQIWTELRSVGFRNEIFPTLNKVVDRLCDTINSLTLSTVKNIMGRDWILDCF